jgi:Tol biopolymer transport system component
MTRRLRHHGRVRPAVPSALLAVAALALLLAAPASAWPGLNGRISFSSDRAPEHASGDLFATSLDGGNVVRLTSDPADDAQSAWSPDGRRVAFKAVRRGSNQLAWMAWDGSAQAQLTRTFRASEGQPAWTPDGRRLLFRRAPENPLVQDGDLWLLDPARTQALEEPAVSPVLERPGDERYPAVSPDGTRIAFRGDLDLRADTGDEELYVAPWDGERAGEPVQVTRDAVPDSAPAWSPDGTRLAFESARDSAAAELRDVYVVRADGRGLRRLTEHPALDEGPAWSPDGTQIAFTSERDGNAEIYVMRADGSRERRLTRDPAKDESPDWQAVPYDAAGARRCGDTRLGPGGAVSVVARGAPCARARATARAVAARATAGRPARRIGRFTCRRPAPHTFDLRLVRCTHVARPGREIAFVLRAPANLRG